MTENNRRVYFRLTIKDIFSELRPMAMHVVGESTFQEGKVFVIKV